MLDPIFSPLLAFGAFWTVIILSFLLSLIITVAYLFLTDQKQMKALKEDMKASQKRMKKLKDNPQKMMKEQREIMQKNMQYMKQSMIPMLVTFIPIIFIFTWMAGNLASHPLSPDDEFIITLDLKRDVYGSITINSTDDGLTYLGDDVVDIRSRSIELPFKAEQEGLWNVRFMVNDEEYAVQVLVDPVEYGSADFRRFDGDAVRRITVGYEKLIVMNLFGWQMGWLITYIIFSIIFSLTLRKVLRVY